MEAPVIPLPVWGATGGNYIPGSLSQKMRKDLSELMTKNRLSEECFPLVKVCCLESIEIVRVVLGGGVLPSPHTLEMNNQMHTKKHQLIGECVLASDYVGISLSLFGGECGQQDMVW